MLIRPERAGDHSAIAGLTARAFAGAKHGDQTEPATEPAIVERLRAAGALTISLVAFDGATLVGHVAFSPFTIDGSDEGWFGLGPVSVEPSRQRAGIGSTLIRTCLERLRTQGAAGCVVLGDPVYYRRFGFGHDDGLRYAEAPPEYFMRISLSDRDSPTGRVDYAPAFTASSGSDEAAPA